MSTGRSHREGNVGRTQPVTIAGGGAQRVEHDLLLAALPRLDTRGRDRPPIMGEIPSPLDPPRGCAFHPRCPHANARCGEERPELEGEPDGSQVACHAVAERRIPVAIFRSDEVAHA